MASLKVSVRVRPFNQREIDMGANLIVEMDGKKTRLHKPKLSTMRDTVRETINDFTFDYSYWSFDAKDKHFTTQEQVYEDLGTDVIDCAFQVDQFADNDSEKDSKTLAECLTATGASESVDVKIEIMENDEDFTENFPSTEELECTEPVINSDKRDFRCKLCDSIYTSKFLLRTHVVRVHLAEQTLKCRQCSKKYRSHLGFQNHLKMHIRHDDVSWTCITDGIQTPFDVNWSTYEDATIGFHEHVKSDEVNGKSGVAEECERVKKRQKKVARPRILERAYKCHKCPQTWRYVNELKNHFKTHPPEEILQLNKCKKCDIYFKSGFELRLHVLEVHFMIKSFNCRRCSYDFQLHESKQFEEHLHQHNINDNVCWSNITKGIRHQESDFDVFEESTSFTEEQYPCEFCTQRFYIKSNLDAHMKSIHSSQRRLQCGQCRSIFTTPKYYFAHQLEHQRVELNISERDDNVLLSNLNSCIEERIIFDKDDHTYRCLICNSKFEIQYDIRSHIRERHVYKMFPPPMEPKREFICDLCGMSLKTKAAVKNHLLIHTNTKSHPCTICGKKFRQNSDRRIHERQHTGEKPFQCHECGKRFISKGLLTAHKRTHDDSTYPCPICGRAFNLPSGYRKHIQTHRQDRSFKCTICSKSFNTRIYLTKHMSIHADKHYQCRFCELKFSTSNGQRQHERYKHQYTPL